MFEAADDSEKFTVPDGIVSFGGAKGFGVVTDRSTLTLIIVLPKDGTSGFLGGIHLELIGFGRVRLPKDWIGGDDGDECVDGLGALVGPNELCTFLEEAS